MTKFTQFLAIASLVAVASCGKKDDDPAPTQPTANVSRAMYMNACISSGPLKVNLNDVAISSITGLDFISSTGYLEIAPVSQAKTTFVLSSSNVKLAETTLDYTANKYYSVYASGIVTSPSVFVTEDDLTVPATNMAKIRLVNLSPDELNETIYIGNNKVDSGITFKEASSFITVNAGTYNLIVQDPNKVPQGRTIPDQKLESGKIYTMVLTGTEAGSGTAALKLNIVGNN